LAKRHEQCNSRHNEELFCVCGIFSLEHEHADFWIIDDVRGALGSTLFCARVGAAIRMHLRWARDHFAYRRVSGIQGFAVVCADVPYRSADFHLDAGAFDDCYFVDRRNYLARDVLSAEGIETRSSVENPFIARQSGGAPYLKNE